VGEVFSAPAHGKKMNVETEFFQKKYFVGNKGF
jgi:hypothetical protein